MTLVAEIVSRSEHQGVTFYSVKVTQGGQTYFLMKRYTDFANLHESLIGNHSQLRPGKLPVKGHLSMKKRMSGTLFMDKRQQALSSYLGDLVDQMANLTSGDDETLKSFLQRDDETPPAALARQKSETTLPEALTHSHPYAHLEVRIIGARGLIAADVNLAGHATSSDPYCKVSLDEWPKDRKDLSNCRAESRTKVLTKTLEPHWDQHFVFPAAGTTPRLHVDVFDEDTFTKDDHIGSLEIDLMSVFPPWEKTGVTGWWPLTRGCDTEDGHEPRGALHLGICWTGYERRQCIKSFVYPAKLPAAPLAPLNMDEIYSASMKINEILWSDLTAPILFWIVDIVFWTHPRQSAAVCACWFLVAMNMQYWPSLRFLAVAAYMLYARQHHQVELAARAAEPSQETAQPRVRRLLSMSSKSHDATSSTTPKLMHSSSMPPVCEESDPDLVDIPHADSAPTLQNRIGSKRVHIVSMASTSSDAPAEPVQCTTEEPETHEEHLNAVAKQIAFVIPANYKNLIRYFQPLVVMLASLLQQLHDVLTWRHPQSQLALCALLLSALALLVVPYEPVVLFNGWLVLFYFSPVKTAACGAWSFALQRRRCTKLPLPEPSDAWLSEEYKKSKAQPLSRETSGRRIFRSSSAHRE